jgi:hypothetical protein
VSPTIIELTSEGLNSLASRLVVFRGELAELHATLFNGPFNRAFETGPTIQKTASLTRLMTCGASTPCEQTSPPA